MSYEGKIITVVMPCYNEEKLVEQSISSIPDFVDHIIAINDSSKDRTEAIISKLCKTNKKILHINNKINRGVGYSIKEGYRKSIELNSDISVVIAGDAQMDTSFIPNLLDPLINEEADYSKGNRLTSQHIYKMPAFRRFGNSLLTFLNKVSTGYWDIIDPQNGYPAITSSAIKKILNEKITDRYGNPNDILIALNIHNLRVVDIEIPAIYGEEKSGINIINFIFKTSWLLLSGFFRRINKKYGGLRLHPVWLFYMCGLLLSSISFILGGFVLNSRLNKESVSLNVVLFTVLLMILGFQSLLFGFIFDIKSNKNN